MKRYDAVLFEMITVPLSNPICDMNRIEYIDSHTKWYEDNFYCAVLITHLRGSYH